MVRGRPINPIRCFRWCMTVRSIQSAVCNGAQTVQSIQSAACDGAWPSDQSNPPAQTSPISTLYQNIAAANAPAPMHGLLPRTCSRVVPLRAVDSPTIRRSRSQVRAGRVHLWQVVDMLAAPIDDTEVDLEVSLTIGSNPHILRLQFNLEFQTKQFAVVTALSDPICADAAPDSDSEADAELDPTKCALPRVDGMGSEWTVWGVGADGTGVGVSGVRVGVDGMVVGVDSTGVGADGMEVVCRPPRPLRCALLELAR
eukprot:1092861-Pyramimonas_sp.AAC.1